MRTDAAGQSALLMVDVAEVLAARGIPYAVIGAMAAAVHGVVRREVEEVFRGRHSRFREELRNGKNRYVAIGQTEQGRTLEIVIAKRKGRIRPISAWESRTARRLLPKR